MKNDFDNFRRFFGISRIQIHRSLFHQQSNNISNFREKRRYLIISTKLFFLRKAKYFLIDSRNSKFITAKGKNNTVNVGIINSTSKLPSRLVFFSMNFRYYSNLNMPLFITRLNDTNIKIVKNAYDTTFDVMI